MWLLFGYGFESCDANGPRNVKIRNWSWKCLNKGKSSRCDSKKRCDSSKLDLAEQKYFSKFRFQVSVGFGLFTSGVEKLTGSSFKGVFKQGPFAYKNGRFASSFFPLRYRIFISLESGKFVFQTFLSETPFKADRVSSCTPNYRLFSRNSLPNLNRPVVVSLRFPLFCTGWNFP